MESSAVEPGAQSLRDPGRYGIRVDVDPRIIEERHLGYLDTVDPQGKLTMVSVIEERHSTNSEGIEAASYRFEDRAAGSFSLRSIWSLISTLSSSLIAVIAIYGLIDPEVDLGFPRWSYYVTLIPIFILSKFFESKHIRRFSELALGNQGLARLKELYGASPLIDLPSGRLQSVREDIERTFQAIPRSKLKVDSSELSSDQPSASAPKQKSDFGG